MPTPWIVKPLTGMAALFTVSILFLCTHGTVYAQDQPTAPQPGIVLEAEDGVLVSTSKRSGGKGFSGSGYVTNFTQDNSSVTVSTTATGGIYDIVIGYRAQNGQKTCSLLVNDTPAGDVVLKASSTFAEAPAGKVELVDGTNTIKIVKNWGWYDVDYIKLVPASIKAREHKTATAGPVNPKTAKEARAVLDYLKGVYGRKIVSGQQTVQDAEWIRKTTGKYPALLGLDLIDYSPSRVERGSKSDDVEKAIAWWKKGGLVTLCWHWNAPSKLIDAPGKEWWRGFYTDSTTFDMAATLANPASEDYKLIIRDIDAIAVQLKRLQAAGVPILWRPLHEAGGRWFWWGAKGPQACRQLYRLLYDRLTNHHRLNNLIWVWSTPEADWYPGDDVVDIIGFDSYPKAGDHSPVLNTYEELVRIVSDKKVVAMTENGSIPDPEKLSSFKADWAWFCTWTGEFINGGKHNDAQYLKRVFTSEYVITLDELPKFK